MANRMKPRFKANDEPKIDEKQLKDGLKALGNKANFSNTFKFAAKDVSCEYDDTLNYQGAATIANRFSNDVSYTGEGNNNTKYNFTFNYGQPKK